MLLFLGLFLFYLWLAVFCFYFNKYFLGSFNLNYWLLNLDLNNCGFNDYISNWNLDIYFNFWFLLSSNFLLNFSLNWLSDYWLNVNNWRFYHYTFLFYFRLSFFIFFRLQFFFQFMFHCLYHIFLMSIIDSDLFCSFLHFWNVFLMNTAISFPVVLNLRCCKTKLSWSLNFWFNWFLWLLASAHQFLHHQSLKFSFFINWFWLLLNFWWGDYWLWSFDWNSSDWLNNCSDWSWNNKCFVKHFINAGISGFFRIQTDYFNNFFIAFFVSNGLFLIICIFKFFIFKIFEENFIWTSPWFLESFFF